MVDITETDTALCLNSVSFDNVILNDTDTFIDNIGLVDVTYTNTRLCLSSVGFPSVILKDTGTPVSVSECQMDGVIHLIVVLHYSVGYGV
jgi:hypothetical protein